MVRGRKAKTETTNLNIGDYRYQLLWLCIEIAKPGLPRFNSFVCNCHVRASSLLPVKYPWAFHLIKRYKNASKAA